MTQESEKRAEAWLRPHGPVRGCTRENVESLAALLDAEREKGARIAELEAELERLRAEVERETLERAARAGCFLCAEGPSVCGREPGKADLWYHPTTSERGAQVCQAGAIRALIPPAEEGK